MVWQGSSIIAYYNISPNLNFCKILNLWVTSALYWQDFFIQLSTIVEFDHIQYAILWLDEPPSMQHKVLGKALIAASLVQLKNLPLQKTNGYDPAHPLHKDRLQTHRLSLMHHKRCEDQQL